MRVADAPSAPREHLLFAGVADADTMFAPALTERFDVAVASTTAEALAVIGRQWPGLVVTHVDAPDGGGITLCASARRAASPITILVTLSDPALAPDALLAGCDGVLLAPFAPNLLYTRIGRLMRCRATRRGFPANLIPHRRPAINQHCPDRQCPHCRASGVISFEFHSHRRAWFACGHCRHVWVDRREEDSCHSPRAGAKGPVKSAQPLAHFTTVTE